MRFLLKRGKGARRRVAHLCGHDPMSGEPTMRALCGTRLAFDMTSNVPFVRICKRCAHAAESV